MTTETAKNELEQLQPQADELLLECQKRRLHYNEIVTEWGKVNGRIRELETFIKLNAQ